MQGGAVCCGVFRCVTTVLVFAAALLVRRLALFGVLFTDGCGTSSTFGTCPGVSPSGLPLTLLLTALFAHFVVELPWAG